MIDSKTSSDILKHRIVSFDIFGTLLIRDVNDYQDVFHIVENLAVKDYGNSFVGFAQKRVNAERKARKLAKREVTLDDIYAQLDCNNKEDIKKIEINTEIVLCQPNMELVELLYYCIKHGCTVLIISDMYLSKEVIDYLLRKKGIEGYSKLYVSSEYGVTKRNGKLFQTVIKELNVKPGSIIHIGDDFRSDYFFAMINGIDAVHVRNEYGTHFMNAENKFFNFINNRIHAIDDDYEKIGYEVYGPLILGFLYWCNINLLKNNIKRVFFASRDCYVIKKAFELLYPGYECVYMKVSRRAVQVPIINIDNKEFSPFLQNASFNPVVSNNSVYKRIGLDVSKKNNQNINNEDLRAFFETDDLIQSNKKKIFAYAEKERIALEKYLDEINFKGDVAFVDVGWKCSTQKTISTLSNANVIGLYLGVHPTVDINVNAKGYLFDREYSDDFFITMGGLSLLESVLTSQEYSLKRYLIQDERVVFDYDVSEILDEDNIVFRIQDGILKFIRDYRVSALFGSSEIYKEDAFDTLKSIISNPAKDSINIFGKIQMENEGKISSILSNNKVDSFKEFIKNYGDSGWKIGFLKTFFKLKLPYRKLYTLSYKLHKKV